MPEHQRGDEAVWEGELFRLLVENVVDYAIFVVDSGGIVRTWSHGAERLLGYRESEIIGETADRFFTPEDVRDDVPRQEMRAARERGRGEDDRWHVRKDGSRLWSSGVMTPLWDERGELRGFAKIMRDRTDWWHAEQARLRSEARTAAVLETALDAIVTIDDRGDVVEFNPAAERMFGYARSDVLGRDMAGLIIPPRLRDAHRRGLARYLATGEGPVLNRRIEIEAVRADGTEFPVELAITRVPVGGPPQFTAYLRDIAGRQAQDRRRAAQLALTQALAEAPSVRDAAPRIVRAICENLGWDMGAFWLVERGDGVLHCLDTWRHPTARIVGFEARSRGSTFGRGEGLPGRVWKTGRPAWVADVAGDENFPRLAVAAEEGVHGAFAFPVLGESDVLGVVEFFSTSAREADPDLMVMVGDFAAQVGQFVERKRTEDSLRESEERFRGLMEQAPLSVQVLAPDGRTLRVNRAWERLWGVTLDQIADYNLLEDPQLEAKGVLDHIRRAFAGEPSAVPAVRYDPNESIPDRTSHADPRRWVTAVAYPLKDAAGRVVEVVVVHDDITERKRAEGALRASEERLRLALEAGRMGTWDWDIRTGELAWSDNLEEVHGLPPGGFDGTVEGFLRLVHPDDRDRVEGAIAHSVEEVSGYEAEFRIARPDGTVGWMLGKGKVFADEAGRPARMTGLGLDVSERKRDEAALRASEQRFARFMQHLPGLAWIKDSQGRYVYANDAAERAFGRPRAALYGRRDEDLFPPETAAQFKEHDRRALASGSGVQVVEALRHEDGVVRHSVVSKFPIPSPDGGGVLVGGMAIDITGRMEMEKALRDSDRLKDEFLATLAHELRNPLAPIRNALHLMRQPEGGGPMETERAMAERQVVHLSRLIDDLMDVARISRGKIELHKEVVDLATVVGQAVETARPQIDERHHRLTVSLPGRAVLLEADPTRLEQVFWNLLNNSAKYTERGGEISLTVEPRDGEVVVRVRDTGIGIDPEMLPRVFDMFVQIEDHKARAQGGLGIGLSLVRTLVQLHGGSIDAHSEGPGTGSEFVVRLPVLARARESTARPPGPPEPPGDSGEGPPRRRILVVDDNVDAAGSLARLLSRLYNQEVRVTHDGPETLAVAGEFRPEVILLDIGLPGMDGNEVARRLRERPEFEATLIVALTGWGQEADVERSRAAGVDYHLVKPANPAAILELLAKNPRAEK